MIEVELALTRILEVLRPGPVEDVALVNALDRYAAGDVLAAHALPPFDNSAFDGYAVRTTDIATAGAEQPVRLRIAAVSKAGSPPADPVDAGVAVRIFTGAPLPPGADGVVMQEDTREDGPEHVLVLDSLKPWAGVRFAGEDARAGARLLSGGMRLGPAQLSLLAAAGITRVPVHRRPRAAFFSTGDELVDPGQKLGPGQIPDSNQVLLELLGRRAGVQSVETGRLPDQLDATMAALDRAAKTADVIVTTGGVSVGDADLLRPALAALGGQLDHWRVAMKPGKPFAFGRLGRAWWFGLPGNPVSAFVTWQVLVAPALRRLAGATEVRARRCRARLAEPLANRGDRRHFVRVTLDQAGEVRSSGTQASHVQSSMALADALLDIPPATAWEAGREVEISLLD